MFHVKHLPADEKEIAELRNTLAILQSAGISVPGDAESRLLAYANLIRAGNAKTQLISRNDLAHVVRRHFRECLAVASAYPVSDVPSLLDLGAGAGLPGIPLAIVFPAQAVTLLESKRKRVRFLQHAKDALALENVTVLAGRAEELQNSQLHRDVVIARAVAPLDKLWKWSRGFVGEQGVLLAMKGGEIAAEQALLMKKYPHVLSTRVEYDHELVQPELERYLLVVRQGKKGGGIE